MQGALNAKRMSYATGVDFLNNLQLLTDEQLAMRLETCPEPLHRYALHLAAERLYPQACHAYYVLCQKTPGLNDPAILDFWKQVCNWLPLKDIVAISARGKYLEGWKKVPCLQEALQLPYDPTPNVRFDGVWQLFAQAAIGGHPLSHIAIRRMNMADLYARTVTALPDLQDPLSLAYQAFIASTDLLRVRNKPYESSQKHGNTQFTRAIQRKGLFAAYIACLLGCTDAATLLIDLCGAHPALLPAVRVAAKQSLRALLCVHKICMQTKTPMLASEAAQIDELISQEGWTIESLELATLSPVYFSEYPISFDAIEDAFAVSVSLPLDFTQLKICCTQGSFVMYCKIENDTATITAPTPSSSCLPPSRTTTTTQHPRIVTPAPAPSSSSSRAIYANALPYYANVPAQPRPVITVPPPKVSSAYDTAVDLDDFPPDTKAVTNQVEGYGVPVVLSNKKNGTPKQYQVDDTEGYTTPTVCTKPVEGYGVVINLSKKATTMQHRADDETEGYTTPTVTSSAAVSATNQVEGYGVPIVTKKGSKQHQADDSEGYRVPVVIPDGEKDNQVEGYGVPIVVKKGDDASDSEGYRTPIIASPASAPGERYTDSKKALTAGKATTDESSTVDGSDVLPIAMYENDPKKPYYANDPNRFQLPNVSYYAATDQPQGYANDPRNALLDPWGRHTSHAPVSIFEAADDAAHVVPTAVAAPTSPSHVQAPPSVVRPASPRVVCVPLPLVAHLPLPQYEPPWNDTSHLLAASPVPISVLDTKKLVPYIRVKRTCDSWDLPDDCLMWACDYPPFSASNYDKLLWNPCFLRHDQETVMQATIPDEGGRLFWREILRTVCFVVEPAGVTYSKCVDMHHTGCVSCGLKCIEPMMVHWHKCEEAVLEGNSPKIVHFQPPHILCALCLTNQVLTNSWFIPWISFTHAIKRMDTEAELFMTHCVRELTQASDRGITMKDWIEVSSWFAPAIGEQFWLRVAWLCSQEWFFGRISTESAVSIAAQHLKTPGAWLLRFSSSEKGGLAFTVAEKNEKITHYRVSREWERGGEFVLRMRPSDRRYENLAALLVGAQEALHLKSPICGSPIATRIVQAGRYEDGDITASFKNATARLAAISATKKKSPP